MLELNIVLGPRGLTGPSDVSPLVAGATPLITLYRGPVAQREALKAGRTFVAAKWNFKPVIVLSYQRNFKPVMALSYPVEFQTS